MEIMIRKAVPEDALEIALVQGYTWLTAYAGLLPEAVLRERLRGIPRKAGQWAGELAGGKRGVVAVAERTVIGFAYYGPSLNEDFSGDGEVYALYLLQPFQGLGAGKKLFAACRTELGKQGYCRFIVNCLRENPAAGFYEKMGGVAVGTRQDALGDGVITEDIWRFETCPVTYANMEQLESWMRLIDVVRWNFPGLASEQELADYRETVIKNIKRGSAICALAGETVVGFLLFSRKYNMLCHMAVHPEYRRGKIATRMIEEMLKQLDPKRDVTVMTFREGDEKGIAPRALYQKLGFVPGDLCYDMDYPEQMFVLHAKASKRGDGI